MRTRKTNLAGNNHKTRGALQELLYAVTSKGAPDTTLPIAWSGSPDQNRRMYAAIAKARRALGLKEVL